MSGAGKSTLAKGLAEMMSLDPHDYDNPVKRNIPVIHIDDYYDCAAGRLKTEEVEAAFAALREKHNMMIVEGVYSMKFDFGYTMRIFMKVSQDEQLRRLSERCPDLLELYVSKWIPAENEYFKEYKTEGKCDYVFDTTQSNY
jgi:shikimate kinase